MLNAHAILKELSFERIAGSAGERRAARIIEGHLRDLGIKYKVEPFTLQGFDTGTASVSCGGTKFPAHPFGLTKNHDIAGELAFVEDGEVVTKNKGAYRGKVVLTYTYTRPLSLMLKSAGIKALIAIGQPLREAPSWSYRQKTFSQGYVPSVTVTYEDGIRLSRLDGKPVRISIRQASGRRVAHNIVADITGSRPDDNLTIACGHYDGVARSPGSSDNAGGTVALIKLAEHFRRNRPRRDLRIIFFSGEELGLRGSFSYVKKHRAEVRKRAGLVVNLDVAGDELGTNSMIVLGSNRLLGFADGVTRELGRPFRAALDIYSSDCMPFAAHEVPSVNLSRWGGKPSCFIHTPGDGVGGTSERGLAPVIDAAQNLLSRVLNAGIYPVDREIDKTLREKIERYLYGSLVEKPKLEWTPEYQR